MMQRKWRGGRREEWMAGDGPPTMVMRGANSGGGRVGWGADGLGHMGAGRRTQRGHGGGEGCMVVRRGGWLGAEKRGNGRRRGATAARWRRRSGSRRRTSEGEGAEMRRGGTHARSMNHGKRHDGEGYVGRCVVQGGSGGVVRWSGEGRGQRGMVGAWGTPTARERSRGTQECGATGTMGDTRRSMRQAWWNGGRGKETHKT